MIKSIPDPQRIHSISCPHCSYSFIVTHLKTTPKFCIHCGASLHESIPSDNEESISLIEGHEPSKESVQFSLGPYQVLSSIGKGGMGEVFLAYDTNTGRKIALKKVRSDLIKHPAVKGRFLKEARITCQLTHPSIIPIYSIYPEGEDIYYTMPFVEGETFKQILREARKAESQGDKNESTSIPALMRIFINICQAIAYAHSKKVLHRDLKPENIIVGKFGEVLILDWGLAKMLESIDEPLPETISHKTKMGKVVGTLSYLAPERALGGEATVQGDIYALGVILYQILTLKMPFHRPSLKEFKKNILHEKLIDPIERAPYREVPLILSKIVQKALSFEKNDRYQTVEELIHDLDNYIEGRSEFFPVAELNITQNEDWEFQENVLITEQYALTRGTELSDWVSLMISKQSFSENLRLNVSFTIEKECQGLGFLISVPERSERKHLTDGLMLWLSANPEEPTKLLRSNIEVLNRPDLILQKDKLTSLRIEKNDKNIHVWINGELELSYISYIPLSGTHVGFLSKDSNFRISPLTLSEGSQNILVNCLSVPDAFLANQDYEKALSEYRRIAYSFPGRSEGREAAFRAGITLLEQGIEAKDLEEKQHLFDKSLTEFEKLQKTPAAPLEYLGKALVYHALNDTEEELKCFELALRRYPKHPLLSILQEQILYRTYESLSTSRKAAYSFLLLILQYLPKLSETHTVKRILNTLVKHAEPLYFMDMPLILKEDRRQLGIMLAFWLMKPFTIYEILASLEEKDPPELIQNGLFALRLLDLDLLQDVLTKKNWTFHPDPHSEKELIYRLNELIDLGEGAKVVEELSFQPLTVPLSCLKIQGYLLSQDLEKSGQELSHFPLEWHTKETTLLPFLYATWLYQTEGKDLAWIHLGGVLETAYPRTWTLASHALIGKLPAKWKEEAFWWEIKELNRQLDFFKRVTGHTL